MDVAAATRAMVAYEVKVTEAVRGAVGDAAHRIERGAKQRAPVKTGTLRRSIMVFGPTPAGVGRWEAFAGPTVIYGRRIELGFHQADRLGRVYDQEGQPFLQPAFDELKAEAAAIFRARIAGVTV